MNSISTLVRPIPYPQPLFNQSNDPAANTAQLYIHYFQLLSLRNGLIQMWYRLGSIRTDKPKVLLWVLFEELTTLRIIDTALGVGILYTFLTRATVEQA